MFKFIKRKIQEWKFMRELKNVKPVCIVVEQTFSFEDVKSPKKKKTKKKVKKNAKVK